MASAMPPPITFVCTIRDEAVTWSEHVLTLPTCGLNNLCLQVFHVLCSSAVTLPLPPYHKRLKGRQHPVRYEQHHGALGFGLHVRSVNTGKVEGEMIHTEDYREARQHVKRYQEALHASNLCIYRGINDAGGRVELLQLPKPLFRVFSPLGC
jgi:hypothetical protein